MSYRVILNLEKGRQSFGFGTIYMQCVDTNPLSLPSQPPSGLFRLETEAAGSVMPASGVNSPLEYEESLPLV